MWTPEKMVEEIKRQIDKATEEERNMVLVREPNRDWTALDILFEVESGSDLGKSFVQKMMQQYNERDKRNQKLN